MEDPSCSGVASVVIRVKEWLLGQSPAQLPRARKRLENALRPMCRLYTIPAHLSLESVLRWLIHRGMLQIEAKPARGESQVTLHNPGHASSAGPGGQELDAELARRLERWCASAVATGTRPSHLRALLAALVQQVLTVRIDVRPELIVAQLAHDGWLQLHNDSDDTITYSLPAVQADASSASRPEGDDHRLRARLAGWLAAMRDREAESRPEGGPRRDWVRFDRVLDSLGNGKDSNNAVTDRPRLAALLLGACTVRWLTSTTTTATTTATATTDAGLYVSLMPPSSQKWSTHVCSTFDEMWDDGFDARIGRKGGVDVLRGVYAYGFDRPSLIQQKVVAPIVNGWDVFFQSQPGTGKSAALAMAVVQRVAALWTIEQERGKEKEEEGSETRQASAGGSGAWKGRRNPMALVITPTRELAQQMHRVIEALGHYFEKGPFRAAHEAKQAAAAAAAAAATAVEEDHADDGREAESWRVRSGGGRDRRHHHDRCWRRERSREEGTMDDDGDGDGEVEVKGEGGEEAVDEEEVRYYHHRRGGTRTQRSPANSEPLLCHALVGATSVRSDMRELKRGPLIVVGSIGRITDMANRKALYLKDLEMLVLDDSTFFFDKATKDALAHLCETYLRGPRPQLVLATTCETAGEGPTFVKHHRRLWRRTAGEGVLKPAKLKAAADASSAGQLATLISADVSAAVVADDFFVADAASLPRPTSTQPATTATRDDARPYLELTIPPDELALEGVRHFFVDVDYEQWKLDTFCDLYSAISIAQCIVFVTTRRKIDWLTEKLHQANYTVSSLHGHLASSERELLLKAGTSRVLITNDLLALGIDVPAVTLVVNYDLPHLPESYLHRSGRCGRFGRKGVVINLVTKDDLLAMNEIAQHFALNVEELPCDVANLL